MGYDKANYLMHDDPWAMHELMDKVTESLIAWVKKQKEVIGEPRTEQRIATSKSTPARMRAFWPPDDELKR